MSKAGVVWLILLIALSVSAQNPTPTPKPSPPPFQSLRYEEDYGYLKDKSKQTGRLDKLKYIPLGRENWYLSLGGEARIRYETFKNVAFGFGTQDKNGYLLQRYLLHSDWHFGKRFRVFAQLQSGIVSGRNGGARPTDKNNLDVHQAFFDYKIVNNEKRSLTVRVGRQEVEFGSGRLIAASEGLNVRRGFDAVRLIYKQKNWTANGLYSKVTSTNQGFFDDKPINDTTLWGVGSIRQRKNGGLSLYYFGFDRKNARFSQTTNREVRQTFGGRLWGNFRKLDYNYELIGQLGTFGNKKIEAWAIASETGLNFPKAFSRFGLKSNITSGDKSANDNKLQSFNPLFPATAYSGQIALIGPTNVMDLSPNYRFRKKKLTLSLDASFYWRQSKNDGVYNLFTNLQRAANANNDRFIGSLFSVRFDYGIDRHTTWTTSYSKFIIGKFFQSNPAAKNVDYFASGVTYRF
jgi:Alginate export